MSEIGEIGDAIIHHKLGNIHARTLATIGWFGGYAPFVLQFESFETAELRVF